MSKKITWDAIHKDFKRHFPNLRKEVEYWCPYDYLTIKIYLKDGRVFSYNYFNKEVQFFSEHWIKK